MDSPSELWIICKTNSLGRRCSRTAPIVPLQLNRLLETLVLAVVAAAQQEHAHRARK